MKRPKGVSKDRWDNGFTYNFNMAKKKTKDQKTWGTYGDTYKHNGQRPDAERRKKVGRAAKRRIGKAV